MKELVAVLASVATIPGFAIYIRGVVRGSVRPHAFSWLVWSVLNAIAFSAQVSEKGGAGSLVSAMVCLGTFSIFVLSLRRGETNIARTDWVCLLGAAVAAVAWLITDDPTISVILITLIDAFGSYPTFRKTFNNPAGESIPLYLIDALAFVAALFALTHVNLRTALFPAFIAVADGSLVALILIRSRQLRINAPDHQGATG